MITEQQRCAVQYAPYRPSADSQYLQSESVAGMPCIPTLTIRNQAAGMVG